MKYCALSLLLVLCQGCIPLEPFIDLETCSYGEPPTQDLLDERCAAQIEKVWQDSTTFDAVIMMEGEEIIFSRGQIHEPSNIASIRKPIVSVLFGIAKDRGLIDIDATLEELGIDDAAQPLTTQERQATVRHLMQSRSGIYLPALGTSSFWYSRSPARGAHQPGTHFFYNNWDFNALASIFLKATGLSLEQALVEWLAKPLGMQSFCSNHVVYESASYTEHDIYRVYMSVHDMALFGALIAQRGAWRGKQIVSTEWIERSTLPVSNREDLALYDSDPTYDGYALLWWTDTTQEHIWGDGYGGQRLLIDMATGRTSVGRNHMGNSAAGYVWSNTGQQQDFTLVGPQELLLLHQKAEECAP